MVKIKSEVSSESDNEKAGTSKLNINQLLLKAANLTNKTKFLHKGLQDLNPQVVGILKKKKDTESESESDEPSKNFSPLAVSTQVKEAPINNKKSKLKPSVKPKKKEVIPPPAVNLNENNASTEDSDSDSTDSDSEPPFRSSLLENMKIKLAEKERDDTSEESSVSEDDTPNTKPPQKKPLTVKKTEKSSLEDERSEEESSSEDEVPTKKFKTNNKRIDESKVQKSSSEDEKLEEESSLEDEAPTKKFKINNKKIDKSEVQKSSSEDQKPSNLQLKKRQIKNNNIKSKIVQKAKESSSEESSDDDEIPVKPSSSAESSDEDVPPEASTVKQSSSSESSSDDEPSNKKQVTPQRKPTKQQPSSSGKKTKPSLLEHRPIKQEKQSSSSESSSDEEQITVKKGLKKTKIGEKTRVNKKQITPQTKKSTKAASSSSEEETSVKLKKDSSSSEESSSSEQETSVVKKKISPKKSKLRKDSSSSEDSSGKGASNNKVNILQNITLQSATSPETDPAIEPIADLLSNLSDSEEMILLQVPKNVKLSESQSIDFSGKEKLKFDKEKYVIKSINEIKNGLLVTDKPRSVRFGGHYIFQKYVKNIDKVPIVVPTKSSVPMPENLKTRHPFFGADYKEKINLDELIEQKLKQAIVDVSKSDKKRKKKKRDSEIEDKPLIFDLLSAHSINKSRKSETTMDSSTDSPVQKKKKKSKLITKIKEEVEDPDIKQEFQSPPLKTKIKKEKFDDFEIENIPLMTGRPSIINSTLIPGAFKSPKFNAEVSRITSETPTPNLNNSKKKKKKKDKNKVDDPLTQDLLSNILNSVKTEIGTIENKRKHSVSGEITEGIKKKKKSKK